MTPIFVCVCVPVSVKDTIRVRAAPIRAVRPYFKPDNIIVHVIGSRTVVDSNTVDRLSDVKYQLTMLTRIIVVMHLLDYILRPHGSGGSSKRCRRGLQLC